MVKMPAIARTTAQTLIHPKNHPSSVMPPDEFISNPSRKEAFMNETPVVAQGIVNADGTLELDKKLTLPPGRVQLIVRSLADEPVGDPFWQMMDRIWAGQKSRGQKRRTKEEIDEEINVIRDEADQEMRQAEQLHEEYRAARTGRQGAE
jgi:hypothetical protein